MSRKTMLRELRDGGFSDEGISLERFKTIAERHGYSNVKCSTMGKLFIFRDNLNGSIVVPRGWYFRTCEKMFENAARGVTSGHSFGIEFEGGIQRASGDIVNSSPNKYSHIGKWGMQGDPTAGFEITTPIITSENGVNEISAQWKHWTNENPGYLPYWRCNKLYHSMGHHVHIGKPTRSLTRSEKIQIAASAIPILPAVYFISANSPYRVEGKIRLSKRMVTTRFAKTINQMLHFGEHQWEIEDSHHGTVEFRGLDCNFPQVSVTCALLLKAAADSASGIPINEREIVAKYSQLKSDILKNRILSYLQARKQLAANLGAFKPKDNYQKEILYIAMVLNENPAQFVGKMNPEFVKNLIQDDNNFLDNVKTKKNEKLINAIKEDIKNFHTIGEMCDAKIKCYSKSKLTDVWSRLKDECGTVEDARVILDKNFDYPKEWFNDVKDRKPKSPKQTTKRVYLRRYFEMQTISGEQAALRIVLMQPTLTLDEIRDSSDRFLIGLYGEEIIGFAQINVPNQKIIRIVGINPEYKKKMEAVISLKYPDFQNEVR